MSTSSANEKTALTTDQSVSRCSVSPKVKICIVAATWGFLTGVERAIIMPTLWLYFLTAFSKDAATHYYGITLAAFNLSVLLISPLYGYFAFKGVRVKALIIVSNQLEVIGNIIYLLAHQPWMILFGRFIAGLGAGSEVPLYADIVRITTTEERTGYIALLLLARQFGLIVGPAFTLLLQPLSVTIGKVNFNVYNGPGLVMSILWTIHTIVTLFIYPHITKHGKVAVFQNPGSTTQLVKDHFYVSKEERSDALELAESEASDKSYDDDTNDAIPLNSGDRLTSATCANYLRPYTRYQSATILTLLFSTYICLMALEAVLPPVAERFFRWNVMKISLVYIACGVFVIFVYGTLTILSKYFSDRSLLLFGCITLSSAYILLMMTTIFMEKERATLFITLALIGIAIHVLGMPFCICSESLLTKTLAAVDSNQLQTVLRTVINISMLIGPFMGGVLQLYPYVVFGFMLFAIATPACFLVGQYDKFSY